MEAKPSISKPYLLHINCLSTLEQMVAEGHFDYVNPDITNDNFSLEGMSDVEVALVHFDRSTQSEDVLSALERLGYRPATLAELAVFGATNPELQRQFPVISLGSVWADPDGDSRVGSLYCCSSGHRELLLEYFVSGWYPRCRFLAVRK